MVIQSCLTIVFDGAFYQAIFEQQTVKTYSVARISLGPTAPTMPEIWQLVNQSWRRLAFQTVVNVPTTKSRHLNPKRRQRQVQKELRYPRSSTRAQVVLQ
ncbi:YjdF family protein [Lactobacillus sp. DCY120]|uniref:YjdF family protein n=1 Tax=Bombilactobacillus apium TaxID=2675299 RepID=A0A850RBN6_9LACO|nr:YjdF family protein [Bombilactobacillus apium]NVY96726.1 YjdF family protein [Bombilactobacillus apium]